MTTSWGLWLYLATCNDARQCRLSWPPTWFFRWRFGGCLPLWHRCCWIKTFHFEATMRDWQRLLGWWQNIELFSMQVSDRCKFYWQLPKRWAQYQVPVFCLSRRRSFRHIVVRRWYLPPLIISRACGSSLGMITFPCLLICSWLMSEMELAPVSTPITPGFRIWAVTSCSGFLLSFWTLWTFLERKRLRYGWVPTLV